LVAHAADGFIPQEVAARMAKETPRATLVEIERSGHVVPLENPSALADALSTFLSD
jgi:pimeloyl-ACP methyl ester carboxylesterase